MGLKQFNFTGSWLWPDPDGRVLSCRIEVVYAVTKYLRFDVYAPGVAAPMYEWARVLVYDPPADLVQTAFLAAGGYMPLDVFADWLQDRDPADLVFDTGESNLVGVLAGLRLAGTLQTRDPADGGP